MGGMILRADPETLKAVRTKTRRGKGEEIAGEEIRILLARRLGYCRYLNWYGKPSLNLSFQQLGEQQYWP
jgi:hypothetical protein